MEAFTGYLTVREFFWKPPAYLPRYILNVSDFIFSWLHEALKPDTVANATCTSIERFVHSLARRIVSIPNTFVHTQGRITYYDFNFREIEHTTTCI